jgi:2'-5' RNA ligase
MTKPKTHHTAVVVIPPASTWPDIQAIRRVHDRQVHRWMPHITLLYPFRPRNEFEQVSDLLARRAAEVKPFELRLAEFAVFRHARRSSTMWLQPEPSGPVIALQSALLSAVPDCDDVNQFANGFCPHLSVGQCRSASQLGQTLAALQAEFRPVRFTVDSVAMIWRSGSPDDPFRIDRTIPLGGEGRIDPAGNAGPFTHRT